MGCEEGMLQQCNVAKTRAKGAGVEGWGGGGGEGKQRRTREKNIFNQGMVGG